MDISVEVETTVAPLLIHSLVGRLAVGARVEVRGGAVLELRRVVCAVTAVFLMLYPCTQAVAQQPIESRTFLHFTDFKPDLSAAEIGKIRTHARQAGKTPWLVLGMTPFEGPTYLCVYLQPDFAQGRLRRGRVLILVTPVTRGKPRNLPWKVDVTASYAQVTARASGDVRSVFDFSRPFQIWGELGLDDAALVSLVDYIRSSPTWTALPKGLAPQTVDGSLPISHVRRTPEGIEVTLLRDNASGETVTLEQRNHQWVVVRIALWIV